MNHELIKQVLIEIGEAVCKKVHLSLKTSSIEQMSAVFHEGADDTIYQIDRDVEEIIVPLLAAKAASLGGVVLLAEGIGEDSLEGVVLPEGTLAKDAKVIMIMDPIDGTRGIMYDKRSAFFLAGAAPNKGKNTNLSDIEVAVMTELPTSRAYLSDTLFAIKGQGAHAFTLNMFDGSKVNKKLKPSGSDTILGGFGQLARFFPPGRDILAAIEDELIETLFPDAPEGRALIFEDQYISSGGQLYEILVGHDRFVADVRVSLYKMLAKKGKKAGHVCHPYDICTMLIGREAGVIITSIEGNEVDAPFDLIYPVEWIGYANTKIQKQVEPVLQQLFKKHNLI